PRVMSVAALRHSLGLRCPSATDCNSCFEVPRSHRRDRRSSETHLPVWPASLPLMHPHNRFTGSNRQTLFVLRRNLPLPPVLSGDCLIEVAHGEMFSSARLDCMRGCCHRAQSAAPVKAP